MPDLHQGRGSGDGQPDRRAKLLSSRTANSRPDSGSASDESEKTRGAARQLRVLVSLKISRPSTGFAQAVLRSPHFPAEAGSVPGSGPNGEHADRSWFRALAANDRHTETDGDVQLIRTQCRISHRHPAPSTYLPAPAPAAAEALRTSLAQIKTKIRALLELPTGPPRIISQAIAAMRGSTQSLRRHCRSEPQVGAQTGPSGHAMEIEEWLALTPIERAAALRRTRQGQNTSQTKA